MAVRFGPFTFDADARQLRRGTETIHLSPKAFDLLALLIERRVSVVNRADIHTRLWRDTFVSDGSLAVLVTELRDALDDDAGHPIYLETVHRVGYRFVGKAVDAVSASTSSGIGIAWLTWGTQRAPLRVGENLLGRDPSADVRIDAVGISRRHAIITVDENAATLYDLDSKNGTFVDGVRVTDPVALTTRTDIQLGPMSIRFHRSDELSSTETLPNSNHSG